MKVIGLTGGSGCGKGYICRMFAEYGIPSVDADEVYRKVSLPGSRCLAELEGHFGSGIIRDDGSLDRAALAKIVFAEGAAGELNYLNGITHKYVLERIEQWLRERKSLGDRAAVVDAPMLFESGFDRKCDFVISVLADREQRMKRLFERDGLVKERIEERLRAQHSDEFFAANSDYTIRNNDGDDLRVQVRSILERTGLYESPDSCGSTR